MSASEMVERGMKALLDELAELRELRAAAIMGLAIPPSVNQTQAAIGILRGFEPPMGFSHDGQNYRVFSGAAAIKALHERLRNGSTNQRHTIITKLTSKGLNELALEIGAKHIAKMELNDGGFDIQLDREFLEALL